MGIRNLAGFIAENKWIMDRHDLKNTKLIVDGQAVQRFLLDNCNRVKRSAEYGCNYVDFANAVRKFFNDLKKVNIEPYVILAGGKNPKLAKQGKQTRLLKVNATFNRYVHQDHDAKQLKPILAARVLAEVVEEMGIPCARTLFDEEGDMVEVANELNCPVLSNDSDFFMFDIKHGFIFLRNLYYDPNSEQLLDHVKCLLYFRSSFVKAFNNLDVRTLPLFCIIAGNGARPRIDDDDVIFEAAKRLGRYDLGRPPKQFTAGYYVNRRIFQILRWLEGKSLERAVDEFCFKVPDYERVIRTAVDDTVHFQDGHQAMGCLLQHLEGVECDKDHSYTFEDKVLSDTHVRQIMNNDLSSSVVDIFFSDNIFAPPQAEDFEQESSFDVSVDLLKCFKNMLRSDEKERSMITISKWQKSKVTGKIEIHEDNLFILPNTNIAELDLPTMDQISEMPAEFKVLLAHSILQATQTSIELIKCALSELVAVTELQVRDQLLVLILLLKYTLSKQKEEQELLFQKFACAQLAIAIYCLTGETVGCTQEQFKKNEIPSCVYRKEIAHCYTQLKSVTKMFFQINGLLGRPLSVFPVSKVYNGVLVYNLVDHEVVQSSKLLELFNCSGARL
ncbi:Protein asteroid -like protein 1 [Halotydeus destructor]|nr:Protein asteroid -like protein 1 [Halotydeus destructor]